MLLFALAAAQDTVIDLDGEVTAGDPAFVLVDFEVPPGVAEIEVRHTAVGDNVLDWGLRGPNGTRGWGGGNSEPAVVGADAASRSYLPGPIEPGIWQVVIGKARLSEPPFAYDLEVVLRETATLPPRPRTPYTPAAPLSVGRRWVAGDLHVHSSESGDANASLDAIAELARSRGLDFVAITDHNVVSTLDFLVEAQARHPDVLFIPAMEFTTYAGHANVLGNTVPLAHTIGLDGATVDGAFTTAREAGGLVSLNHPVLDLGDRCIGCAWEHPIEPTLVDAVEIGTGGLSPAGALFVEDAIAFWDALCADGHHLAALGGSDDHRAGEDLGLTGSPIGDPTTMVEVDELSVAGVLAGIRAGRTVVKLQGPDDPMVELTVADETARVVVTGGIGRSLRLIRDGQITGDILDIDADPFAHELGFSAFEVGADSRLRAEVWEGGLPRVVTSHVWVEPGILGREKTCGCATSGALGAWPLLALFALRRRR